MTKNGFPLLVIAIKHWRWMVAPAKTLVVWHAYFGSLSDKWLPELTHKARDGEKARFRKYPAFESRQGLEVNVK